MDYSLVALTNTYGTFRYFVFVIETVFVISFPTKYSTWYVLPAGAAASVKLLRYLYRTLVVSLLVDLHDNFIISPVVIPTSSMKNKPRQNSLIFCLEDFVK